MPRIAAGLVDEISIELPQDWNRYVDEPLIEKDVDGLCQSINRQSPYGTSIWQIQVSQQLRLESTARLRGRPRKKIGKE